MQNAALFAPSTSRTGGNSRVDQPRFSGTVRAAAIGAPPDEELIARVCWREEAALQIIYDRYHRLIFTIALRMVGDRELAEEVVQDVFQAVWQSAGSFQRDGNMSAWLIGITRHRAIDATRSRRFRSRAREDVLDEERMHNTAGTTHTDTDMLMLRTIMHAALAELPTTQRQAIELGYYGGLTHTEIAKQLGEPVGTIKSRMRMGLMKLRDLLKTVEDG
jgi:RNA polymerase sigma-70 factor (ECF subfamily)